MCLEISASYRDVIVLVATQYDVNNIQNKGGDKYNVESTSAKMHGLWGNRKTIPSTLKTNIWLADACDCTGAQANMCKGLLFFFCSQKYRLLEP